MTSFIRSEEIEGGVQLITVDRPDKRNAFTSAMYDALRACLIAAEAADDVKVVVITGAGAVFSAGQDLAELATIAERHAAGESVANGFPAVLETISGFPKPLVMAVNGAAVGWGFTMLAHADIVVVGDSARLRVPFAEFGVPPEAGASYLLPARVGWQRAASILLTGDWVSAAEAVEWGLALRCVADDDVVPVAVEIATRIATASTQALMAIKSTMLAWQRPLVSAALDAEADGYRSGLGHDTAATIRARR